MRRARFRASVSAASGARVRAPALSRRLSSFLFAGWLPHAKYASWGCLGLTRGDRRCRSQFSEEDSPNRRRRPGHRLVCCVLSAGQLGTLTGEAKQPIAQMNPTSSRAMAVITIGAFFRLASICRYRAQSRTCAFHAALVSTLHALSHLRWHPVGPGGFDDQFARDSAFRPLSAHRERGRGRPSTGAGYRSVLYQPPLTRTHWPNRAVRWT
jgi:hypothetical protein